MVKKVGICWNFKTVQNPTRLAVSTDTSFFAVFQANLLNKNEILAINIEKTAKDQTKIDRKRYFLRYFNYTIKRKIPALQIRPKFTVAKTSKMVYLGS